MSTNKTLAVEETAAVWQNLFRDTERRTSELQFYSDEITFLKNLLDRYPLWLMEEESLATLQVVSASLKKTEESCKTLIFSNNSTRDRLGLLIENPFAQDEYKIKSDFRSDGDKLESLTVDMKSVKTEIFKLVEQCFRTEKARKLIGNQK
ncbi:MAG: hypothetical protein FJZ78_08215 [Bacteroidetes bacterium]|nr:hypothetical protein [Bacteroidota bacterium]